MSLQNRLEKLRFIVQELETAHFIANALSDGFAARTVARHVLVRAKDFIDHVRQVKNLLGASGHDVRGLNRAIQTYSTYFTEYFEQSRHSLGGHVQDVDFGERIELWNDIETVKSHFFVEAALQIYADHLGPMGLPELQAYARSPDLEGAKGRELVRLLGALALSDGGPSFGSDVLAMTRPNTAGIIAGALVQQRAGQLLAIELWISVEAGLRAALAGYEDCTLVLKARLLTDIISFADCLITRRDVATAHRLEGLDRLVSDQPTATLIFQQFLVNVRVDDHLANIRKVRNRIGGHVEDSESVSLKAIKDELVELNGSIAVEFFRLLRGVFRYICRSVYYLNPFLISGERIAGVISVSDSGSVVPFRATDLPAPPEAPVLDVHSQVSYQKALELWHAGGTTAEEARSFMFSAFMHSPILHHEDEVEMLSATASRTTSHPWREVHQFLLDHWVAETDRGRAYRTLGLLTALSNTDAYALSALIVGYVQAGASLVERGDLWLALAEVGQAPHRRAEELLKLELRTGERLSRVTALVASVMLPVYGQWSRRANGESCEPFLEHALADLTSLPMHDQYVVLVACLSRLATDRKHGTLGYFSDEAAAIKGFIRRRFDKLAPRSRLKAVRPSLDRLLRNNQAAGLALLVALGDKRRDRRASPELRAVAAGIIRISDDPHEQSMAVYCLQEAGFYPQALELALHLSSRYPTVAFPHFLALASLMRIPNTAVLVEGKLTYLKTFYHLRGKWAKKYRQAWSQHQQRLR